MKNNILKMWFALLVVALVFNSLTVYAQSINEIDDYSIPQNVSEMAELCILTATLGKPVGMQGFEGDYAIKSPNDIIEIIVQFAEPSSVALQLLQERETPEGRAMSGRRRGRDRTLPDSSLVEQSLTAHSKFRQRLNQISSTALARGGVEEKRRTARCEPLVATAGSGQATTRDKDPRRVGR